MIKRRGLLLLGTFVGLAISPAAQAGFLDPNRFASLGTLNLAAGNDTINTDGAPTLRDSSNNILFTGTTFTQGGDFNPTISILDFDSITVGAGANIRIAGANPLALLSRSDALIAGRLDGSGFADAEALLNEALTADPGKQEYLSSRADLLVNRGNLDVAAGRVEDGIARYGRGPRDILPLLEAEPNVQRLKTTAVNLNGARVVAHEPPGPVAVGHALFRILCLARGGDHEAVARESKPLEDRDELAAVDRYNLGCALSLASAAAPHASPARTDLRARSLRAVAADPSLRKTAQQDADLAPLADDPAFRKSLAAP